MNELHSNQSKKNISGFLGSLGQDLANSKSVKVLDLLEDVNSTAIIVHSNNDVNHFIDSTTQSLHKSEAENKTNEVKSLVKEVYKQVSTNSTKAKVEDAMESIAKETAFKKDEAKVASFLKSIPEVIPKVNVTKV